KRAGQVRRSGRELKSGANPESRSEQSGAHLDSGSAPSARPGMTPREQRKLADEARHNYESASRKVSDWMNLSPVCTHPRCRRARRCNGDFDGACLFCFREVPGEVRFWVDKLCEAVAQGGSIEEANEIAGMAVLKFRRNREEQQIFDGIRDYARKVLDRAHKRMREEEEEDEFNSRTAMQ
ncbi:MAG TPA: hypothetical protein VL198_08920, partial [Pseudolabrys sp.]|nr:hypothetical protein [Pseudolabrys sp.]